MATESTLTAYPSTLLEELVERTRLSWLQITVVVGLVLILFLAAAAYLDGVLAGAFNAELWRNALVHPATIAYFLLIQPVLRRLRDGAIQAFRPLVPMDGDDLHRLVAKASLFNRRREWLALGIGTVGGLLLVRPWAYFSSFWLTLYGLLSVGLMYALAGFFIYSSLSGTGLFTELQRHTLEINVFELRRLEPIGRWSLGIALCYVGGMTLSLLFIGRPTLGLEIIIIYGTFTLAPVLVFFLNMMSTHRVMVEAKKRELSMVSDNLAAAFQALKERSAERRAEDMEAVSDSVSITDWEAYERRVQAVPEWPYTANIMRKLVLSILLPVAVGIAQIVLLNLIGRLLSLPR